MFFMTVTPFDPLVQAMTGAPSDSVPSRFTAGIYRLDLLCASIRAITVPSPPESKIQQLSSSPSGWGHDLVQD